MRTGPPIPARLAGIVVAAVLATLTTTGPAAADASDCSSVGEEAHRERAEGKLLSARDHLLSCAERCAPEVAGPCQSAATEILGVLPSIVVVARDAEGNDVTDAAIAVDGVTIAQELDGRAFAVDPGAHEVTVTRRGVSTNQKVVVAEGVKGLVVDARLRMNDPDGMARDMAGHTIWPWALVAIGGAIVVGGIAVILTAPGVPAGCDTGTRTCTASPSETSQALSERESQAGEAVAQPIIGGITVGVGALVVAGALAWHFMETTEPGNSAGAQKLKLRRLSPWLGHGSAGLAAGGVF